MRSDAVGTNLALQDDYDQEHDRHQHAASNDPAEKVGHAASGQQPSCENSNEVRQAKR
jgi:hypothetical protein